MFKKQALQLIQQYIDGWKENNLDKIISCLAANCLVIESHGPTYHGISAIKSWFKLWLEAKSHIVKWELLASYYSEETQNLTVEWDFCCISNNCEYTFRGCSIVKFADEKIASINEYRMTQPSYDWQGDMLKSE